MLLYHGTVTVRYCRIATSRKKGACGLQLPCMVRVHQRARQTPTATKTCGNTVVERTLFCRMQTEDMAVQLHKRSGRRGGDKRKETLIAALIKKNLNLWPVTPREHGVWSSELKKIYVAKAINTNLSVDPLKATVCSPCIMQTGLNRRSRRRSLATLLPHKIARWLRSS
ncbi:hypothetical protein TGME49_236635 [Toxoplasma gondii ME49]|uniref:Uncharacterized protein n=3 Tax=Toxoplasma gondii TaxID=5811 RepID=A0A086JHT7_TOXGO|nr:hypothetical protein TGME49_236635 [Toxoplasma gondii ME49]EPT26655.1 hypothetical protein TGME49_236635 [Toxoplasma gondii ME49]KFG31705.1 hypothetical protein TGDOM2_236635 [Toxoplasma gondii GAB2-2007-GAL-DOM2]KYF43066.1 hypothetical protein TGARI_236635 [Toxoplasma gondii ARI]|eukprot:XP_018635788.1 hypothetical protein TGME49_236635 [Toxoplasma gondii ME49]